MASKIEISFIFICITEPNEEYKILLIGKDGGVKFEGENRTLQQIFNQIDTMPMRRNEMQFDSC